MLCLLSHRAQIKSTKPTAQAYTIPRTDSFRTPKGQSWHSKSQDNLYLGEAHLVHQIAPTPGPGKYEMRKNNSAFGKSALSSKKHKPSYSFGTTSRFGYVERNIRKTATPGPGAYVN